MLSYASISIMNIIYCGAETNGKRAAGAAGAAVPLRSPEGNVSVRVVHARGRDRKEKGATGEPATPS